MWGAGVYTLVHPSQSWSFPDMHNSLEVERVFIIIIIILTLPPPLLNSIGKVDTADMYIIQRKEE